MTDIVKLFTEHIRETYQIILDTFQRKFMYSTKGEFKNFFRKVTTFSQNLHKPSKSIIISLVLFKGVGLVLSYLGIMSPEYLGPIKGFMAFAGTNMNHFWKTKGESIQKSLELIERFSDYLRSRPKDKQ